MWEIWNNMFFFRVDFFRSIYIFVLWDLGELLIEVKKRELEMWIERRIKKLVGFKINGK